MSLADEVERGQRAARLLSDPLFQNAFADVRKAVHEAWEKTPIRDVEGQHELRLMLKVMDEVKAVFERAIADGTVSADELNRAAKVVSPAAWSAIHRR